LSTKKLIIIIGIILISIIFISFSVFKFFNKKMISNSKIGNNSSSQEIINHILNISSYELIAEVEIKSNKTVNKYKMKQQYIYPDIQTQEIIEPENISGVKLMRNKNEIKLINTTLNLVTIFKEHQYITNNILNLSDFIEEYKKDDKTSYKEENNHIILELNSKRSLYIDKNTGEIMKMQIEDNNKNTMVYILYNEVKVNSLEEEKIENK